MSEPHDRLKSRLAFAFMCLMALLTIIGEGLIDMIWP